MKFSHFGAPNSFKFYDFDKIQGFFRPGFKTVKFSHFGAPNSSNSMILIKFKGFRPGFKTVKLSHFGAPKQLKFYDFDKIQGFQAWIQNREI